MIWIIGIFLIFIAIIFLIFYRSFPSDFSSNIDLNSPIYPTLHAYCLKDPKCDGTICVNDCGGDLICDKSLNRCKKKLGGDCSSTVDCENGLVCSNWICSHHTSDLSSTSPISISPDKKQVHWDNNFEIFQIPSRSHKSFSF